MEISLVKIYFGNIKKHLIKNSQKFVAKEVSSLKKVTKILKLKRLIHSNERTQHSLALKELRLN
jgi:hypothetical protein